MIPAFTMIDGEIEISGGLKIYCLITNLEHKCIPKENAIIDVKIAGDKLDTIVPILENEVFENRSITLYPNYENAKSTISASIEMIRYVESSSFYDRHIALTCHVTSIKYRRKRWITVRKLLKHIVSAIH